MKERDIEVERVGAWREVRQRAAQVLGVARKLAGQARDWLGDRIDRVAERVLDKFRQAGPDLVYKVARPSGSAGRSGLRKWGGPEPADRTDRLDLADSKAGIFTTRLRAVLAERSGTPVRGARAATT